MKVGTSDAVIRETRALWQLGAAGAWTDGQLLERFSARRDELAESAFAALVVRHGPMVRRVCRNLLGNAHDAEDAAQAVFLVLARRAASIRRRDSVASWLHGVACRVAAKARTEAARRRAREQRGAALAPRSHEPWPGAGTYPELEEELARLPERFRAPVVLCHLEGLTYEQAAQRLRCPVRTVQSRLARGRARLRERLERRGLAPSAGWMGLAPVGRPGPAPLPTAWAEVAVWQAVTFTAGRSQAIGLVPPPGAAVVLAEGVLTSMTFSKMRMLTLSLLALNFVAIGAGAVVQRGARPATPAAEDQAKPGRSAPARPTDADEAPRELARDDGQAAGKRSIAGSGHVVAFEAPREGWSLTRVRIFGSRYGYPQPPAEDFKVYVCDEEFKAVAEFAFPYAKFERGEPKWVNLDVEPTPVPAKFRLCVSFNPEQAKGVYVHHDKGGSGTSFVGLPGRDTRPFDAGDWMIRARVEPSKK